MQEKSKKSIDGGRVPVDVDIDLRIMICQCIVHNRNQNLQFNRERGKSFDSMGVMEKIKNKNGGNKFSLLIDASFRLFLVACYATL